LLIIILFLAGINTLSAQTPEDTTKPKVPLKVVTFSEENFNYGNSGLADSVFYRLDSFQVVHPLLISTGNLGSPAKTLSIQYTPAEPFSVRPDAFGYFGFNRYNRKFYHTNQPYTLLQYFVGQPKEQYVDVIHARNFGDNLNFSFHFIRARSEGFYKRQNTSNTSVRTNLWYKSPGKRYALMTDIFWTGENVAENGGLANDSSFEFSDQLDRQIVSVNLNNAGTIQRKRGVWMKHTFALGKVTDTLVLDSARMYTVITPAWGISIVSELFDEKYNYNDAFPQSGFYDVVYRDTMVTNDSTYCWRINNSVRLEKFDQYGAKTFHGYVGARHETGEYFNDTIYRHFQNVYAEGMASWTSRDTSLNFIGHASFVVAGYNAGNYSYDGLVQAPVNFGKKKVKGMSLFIRGWAAVTSPDMIYMNYSGNHLQWINSFVNEQESGLSAGFSYKGSSWMESAGIKSTFVEYDELLYFDSTFLPQQYKSPVNVTKGDVYAAFNFSPVHVGVKYTYTHVSNDSVLRLPEHIVAGSVYGNFQLFKKAMQLQVGIDATWFSEFTAAAYMPAVAQFYLQNQRTVGNYVYLDPWVSFRIKPVRVFIKAEHINAGWFGRKYFLMDHYVHNDFALKIGLSWLFND